MFVELSGIIAIRRGLVNSAIVEIPLNLLIFVILYYVHGIMTACRDPMAGGFVH